MLAFFQRWELLADAQSPAAKRALGGSHVPASAACERTSSPNVGALIIRIGFGDMVYYKFNKEPQNPIPTVKAPTLEWSKMEFSVLQDLCFQPAEQKITDCARQHLGTLFAQAVEEELSIARHGEEWH